MMWFEVGKEETRFDETGNRNIRCQKGQLNFLLLFYSKRRGKKPV